MQGLGGSGRVGLRLGGVKATRQCLRDGYVWRAGGMGVLGRAGGLMASEAVLDVL